MSQIDTSIATLGSTMPESPRCSSPSSPFSTFPEADGEPLLPRIPNEITFANIVPKLTWKDFYVLAAVSPAWCHAIRSRQVYDERVRSQSTETLILFSYELCVHDEAKAISLYSRTDNAFYQLPPIPLVDRGTPDVCKWVVLNGKVYVVGAVKSPFKGTCSSFVFDLAGQRQWQNCGDIRQIRDGIFECGVLDRKIYVFGGCDRPCSVNRSAVFNAVTSRWSPLKPMPSEVFDPVANSWSPIKHMPIWCFEHRVAAIGDELFVYGGKEPGLFPAESDSDDDEDDIIYFADSLHVYHPARDEWRVVENFRIVKNEVIFMAQGKLHSMSQAGIHVYNAVQNSWTHLHSCSWSLLVPVDLLEIPLEIIPLAVVAVDDELFAIVFMSIEQSWTHLFRSGGFGSENKELEWEIVQFPSSFGISLDYYEGCYMYPVQL